MKTRRPNVHFVTKNKRLVATGYVLICLSWLRVDISWARWCLSTFIMCWALRGPRPDTNWRECAVCGHWLHLFRSTPTSFTRFMNSISSILNNWLASSLWRPPPVCNKAAGNIGCNLRPSISRSWLHNWVKHNNGSWTYLAKPIACLIRPGILVPNSSSVFLLAANNLAISLSINSICKLPSLTSSCCSLSFKRLKIHFISSTRIKASLFSLLITITLGFFLIINSSNLRMSSYFSSRSRVKNSPRFDSAFEIVWLNLWLKLRIRTYSSRSPAPFTKLATATVPKQSPPDSSISLVVNVMANTFKPWSL